MKERGKAHLFIFGSPSFTAPVSRYNRFYVKMYPLDTNTQENKAQKPIEAVAVLLA